MTKTHLIADPTLGGLQREYVESDREVDVGDFVVCLSNSFDLTYGNIYEIIGESITRNSFGNTGLQFLDDTGAKRAFWSTEKYKTLEPTDIVRVEGVRYKLVDRKASVGEKVVVVKDWYEDKVGTILEVIDGYEFGFDSDITYIKADTNEYNRRIKFIDACTNSKGGSYCSVTCADKAEGKYVEVNASQASPEVIEMLANLSQRIVSLESQVEDNLEALETHALKIVRLEDEIDTLHANQKRMAEELENTKAQADNDTVVAELARLLARESRKVGR